MISETTTGEWTTSSDHATGDVGDQAVVATIAAHPDLARIGARAALGPFGRPGEPA